MLLQIAIVQPLYKLKSNLLSKLVLSAGCHLPDYTKDGTREGHQHLTYPARIKVGILVSPGRARLTSSFTA